MWRFLPKAAVSGVLVWLLLRHLALDALLQQMLAVDRGPLLLAALCYASIGVPAAWRWSLLFGLLQLAVRLPGGLVWLATSGRRAAAL